MPLAVTKHLTYYETSYSTKQMYPDIDLVTGGIGRLDFLLNLTYAIFGRLEGWKIGNIEKKKKASFSVER